MATEEQNVFGVDFDEMQPKAGSSNDVEDEQWIELDPGESVVGELRDYQHDCGEYGSTVIRLATALGVERPMWSNGQINAQLDFDDDGDLGSVIGIRKSEEMVTRVIDGEEREFFEFEVREVK